MKNYIFKETKVTTKKLVGFYDSENHTIEVDGENKDVLQELEIFNGCPLELVLKIKEENDLSDE